MNMECCGKEMVEVWAVTDVDDERDETYEGLVGYECECCGLRIDLNGEVI